MVDGIGMSTGGTTSKQVADLVGRLGKGELGAAFLAGYQQPAAETARVVEHGEQAVNPVA